MPQKYFLFHGKDWVTEYEKEYLPRWHRVQCAAESIDKLKDRLSVIQRAVAQQQKGIDQNKNSIENCNLPGLEEDIKKLQKILERHEEIASTEDNKEDSTARAKFIETLKKDIEQKEMLIKDISTPSDKIVPGIQLFILKQEAQLKKLQQKANDLNKELVSKEAQLENDKVYVQFFQSALSMKIDRALDETFDVLNLRPKMSSP